MDAKGNRSENKQRRAQRDAGGPLEDFCGSAMTSTTNARRDPQASATWTRQRFPLAAWPLAAEGLGKIAGAQLARNGEYRML